jgi:hypothetical protein
VRKLQARKKTVSIDGAVFTLAKPTTAQVMAWAEGMDQNKGEDGAKERVKVIVALVLGCLNDADPELNLTAEDIDKELDPNTFSFLYEEVLKYAGYTLKKEDPSVNPTPAALPTKSPTSEAA